MKTSKIIFLSLLGAFALIMLATFIDIRMTGTRNSDWQKEFKTNREILHTFKAISMSNSMNVTLVQNDSSYIEVTFLKDSIAPKVNYSVNGDTLFISDFEKLVHRNVSVTIHATDSLTNVRLKNSNLNVSRIGNRNLSFDLFKSSLSLNRDTIVKTAVPAIYIVAWNHSQINSEEFTIDTLRLDMHNSEANLELIAKNLIGTLSDSSKINIRQPESISLKKDGTSKINVNDY